MNKVTAMPAIGSPTRKPRDTAMRPIRAPAEDRASSQECRASAMSVAELMRRPTMSLYRATTWVVDRIAEQPDRAGQDRQQQFHDAGRGQPDRADRDRPVGVPAFLHVIPGAGQRKRGRRVAYAGGLMHFASMAGHWQRGKSSEQTTVPHAALRPAPLLLHSIADSRKERWDDRQ